MVLRGPAAEVDLGNKLRLDPDAFAAALFLRKLAERGCIAAQRLQLLPQVARRLHRVAGARAAGVFQYTVLKIAEYQRADRTFEVGRILVSDDDEFLVLLAFRFDPIIAAA